MRKDGISDGCDPTARLAWEISPGTDGPRTARELRHGRVCMHTRAAVWIEILVATHVDDLVLGIRATCRAHQATKSRTSSYSGLGSFRGVSIKHAIDNTIFVKTPHGRRTRHALPPSRSMQLDESVTEDEQAKFMSVTGVSCGSRRTPFLCGFRQLLCNSTRKCSQEDPTVGLTIKSVLAWSSRAGPPMQMCLAAVSEAPHGNASAYSDRLGVRRGCPKREGHGGVFFGNRGPL